MKPAKTPHRNDKLPKLTKSAKTSTVRIIAGAYRRRLVTFIEADGLRPTPDRVRETVFNWLDPALPNAHVLDCCAGSGVLGFEALSRGANAVTMIEPNLAQVKHLHQTQHTLNIDKARLTIHSELAQAILSQPAPKPFDVVFIDPPYALGLWQPILTLLIANKWITATSLLYIESDQPHAMILGEWQTQLVVLKEKKMGQVYSGLYQWQSANL